MPRCLVALACLATVAHAAPAVLQVEVELERLDRPEDLTWSQSEPIGLEVPETAAAYWFQIGCKPGDVIERIDSDATSTLQRGLDEGMHTLALRRGGKPVLLRVLVHGPQFRTQHLKASDAADLIEQLSKLDPGTLAAALRRSPGVRIVQFNIGTDLELRPGDIVRTIGGARIESEAELRRALETIAIGHSDVVLIRDGRTITVTWEREP